MRHGVSCILKENVKLIHLCVCMCVYKSTVGGGGAALVIWLQFSVLMERSEEDRGSERQRQREREEARAELVTLSVMQFITCLPLWFR